MRLIDPSAKTDFPFRALEFFNNPSKSVKELGEKHPCRLPFTSGISKLLLRSSQTSGFDGGKHAVEEYAGDLVEGFRARGAEAPDTSKDSEALAVQNE